MELQAVMVLLTTALNGIVLFLAFQRVFLGEAADEMQRSGVVS
ncbi:MAG: hypothetical protein U0787_16495 [Polyangia bacterium]